MKKIYSLILGLLLSVSVFGQNVTYTDLATANEAKQNGVFHFDFDNQFTLEALNKASAFYTDHFTVVYTKTKVGHSATITMVNGDPLARRVIERYFATLGVQKIDIDGTPLEVRPFLMKFVMYPAK